MARLIIKLFLVSEISVPFGSTYNVAIGEPEDVSSAGFCMFCLLKYSDKIR